MIVYKPKLKYFDDADFPKDLVDGRYKQKLPKYLFNFLDDVKETYSIGCF